MRVNVDEELQGALGVYYKLNDLLVCGFAI